MSLDLLLLHDWTDQQDSYEMVLDGMSGLRGAADVDEHVGFFRCSGEP